MSGNHRTALTRHALSVFPCGAFLKEKPRKIIFAGNVRAADGRAQRADPSGFMAFFLVLFLSLKEKERKKSPAKCFLRGMCVPLTGGRGGAVQAGLWLSLWFSFRLLERKENEVKQNGTEQRGRYQEKRACFAFEKMSNFVDICRISANLLHPFPKCDRINHHHFPGVGGWDLTFGKGGNGHGEQRLAINGTSGDAAPYGGHAAAAGRRAAS